MPIPESFRLVSTDSLRTQVPSMETPVDLESGTSVTSCTYVESRRMGDGNPHSHDPQIIWLRKVSDRLVSSDPTPSPIKRSRSPYETDPFSVTSRSLSGSR